MFSFGFEQRGILHVGFLHPNSLFVYIYKYAYLLLCKTKLHNKP